MIILPQSLIAVEAEQAPELARIAILNFEDHTGTGDYQYMSESLGDAVNSSMLKNFTYERIDPVEAQKALEKARETLTSKKKEGQEKSDAKENELLQILKEASKELKADIVILGHYEFDQKTQDLVIYTSLYYVASREINDLPVVANKVDNTIFKVTAKTADTIIGVIQKLAQQVAEAEKAASQESEATAQEKSESPAGASSKIVLTKKFAKTLSRFMDRHNGTIVDNKTGLIWQKCALNKGSKNRCSSQIPQGNFEQAVAYCNSLETAGQKWILPGKIELQSIVNFKVKRPSIYILFAPYTDGYTNPYWTSTESSSPTDNVVIDFSDGSVQYQAKNKTLNIRCVVANPEAAAYLEREATSLNIKDVVSHDIFKYNELYLEGGSQGIYYSVKYGRYLDRKGFSAFRIGAGYVPRDPVQIISAQAGFSFHPIRPIILELSAIGSYYLIGDTREISVGASFGAGYTFIILDTIFIRPMAYIMYSKNINNASDGVFQPWGGLSAGWLF